MGSITVIGSGSRGNGYVLGVGRSKLVIELGCKFEEYIKVVDGKIDEIAGCLVSHRHADHGRHIPSALRYRLPVYSCPDVAACYPGVRGLEAGRKYRIGEFTVQPIPVEHSVENYAYMVDNEDMGRVLFITDCVRFPYRVKGVGHLFVEANYGNEIMLGHLCDNQDIRGTNRWHMEINDTLGCIRNNLSPALNTICLLHLSDGQSDEESFKRQVYDEVGIMPYVAEKGLVIELNKEEF